MEVESRKRGREQERLESERIVKKADRGGREEEEEKEMGVFEFPWQKGREGVMTEEEWKEAGVVLGDTFLGKLGRCCREREEVEIGGGMWWMEDMTSSTSSSCSSSSTTTTTTTTLSLGLLNLEEWWDDRDGIWASLLH
ncbi:hypothetical protein MLD38_027722 [Melastoma candidum]|uniref:Uncharacterized protein n=1 Tax=Melastoma candidum TaxID=119954 RepID=A0ACB9P8D7_9MYRT|nr:hypothetical protein MLD38_027722 [Melastoma candidum]